MGPSATTSDTVTFYSASGDTGYYVAPTTCYVQCYSSAVSRCVLGDSSSSVPLVCSLVYSSNVPIYSAVPKIDITSVYSQLIFLVTLSVGLSVSTLNNVSVVFG